jgi:hypothetical protein
MLLAEEFLLLGLDPIEGIVINNARRELLVGLAGALVAELALAGQDRTSVVARTEGRKPLAPGQEVTFRVQPEDVFAFHPVTGARLAG